MNRELIHVSQWLKVNEHFLNMGKTHTLVAINAICM